VRLDVRLSGPSGRNRRSGSLGQDEPGENGAAWRSRSIESLISVVCADPQQPQLVSTAFSATKMREEDIHRRTQRKSKTAGRFMSPAELGGRLSPAQADRAADEP